MPKKPKKPKKRTNRNQRPREVDVRYTPGLADSVMRELAPLLAEDGIDLDDPNLDLETLKLALDRAVERRNLALFTPVGKARDLAVSVIRRAVAALIDNQPYAAMDVLAGAVPESPDTTVAEVSSCVGVALGLVDDVLAGRHPDAPAGLGRRLRRSPIEGPGEVSALDILAAARHGGSFHAMQELILQFGGRELHYGSANALAMVVDAWSRASGRKSTDLIRTYVR